ncbi:hypothetical protein ACGFIU_19450 [Rhodococcus oryzae]|uniref:hypothetical protein n=1 Tax=Rhodococcus oryzae TaxID=2571143 RepID=UPI00371798B3
MPAESHPTSDDLDLYVEVMKDIKVRLNWAHDLLALTPDTITIENAALQIRCAIELIMISSLISNRAALNQAQRTLGKKDADAVQKLVNRINPDYWPIPPHAVRAEYSLNNSGDPIPDDFLCADEFGRAIGTTSQWLHARNPYALALDLEKGHQDLTLLLDRTIRLIDVHSRQLADADRMILCHLDYDRKPGDDPASGNVLVLVAERISKS